MHGGSMAVFVNSERDGRMLDMQPSTAHFSPYFSIQGNSFTKHIYIGSERIASMTGTLSPGDVSNSPAGGYNISHAGYDVGVTQLNIPYATRRAAMIDSAEANYAYFDLPNALEGQTRQTREFVLPAEDSDNAGNSVSGNDGSVGSGTGPRGDNTYYGNIWFIHTDHLGSSTLVTDGNGDISQQIEYLPYGEVFLEGQAGNYATPYKFNGKELDEETGLYYYGARYMNPRLSIWYGCDPLQEKYPNVSSYSYCVDNPIIIKDSDGNKIIFINGKIGFGSPPAGKLYWGGENSSFVVGAKDYFKDNHIAFTGKDYGYLSTASRRTNQGYNYAKEHYAEWISDMDEGESFKLVSHSMGGAFSKGIENYIKEQGREVEFNVMINTYQVNFIENKNTDDTYYIDYQNTNDPVLFWCDINLGLGKLKNADAVIREKTEQRDFDKKHRSPIDGGRCFWDSLNNKIETISTSTKQ